MRNVILRSIVSGLMLGSIFCMAYSVPHSAPAYAAATNTRTLSGINMFEGIGNAGVKQDPRKVIKNIINVVMGFLGMLAVLVILYAGFRWMTAAGNKEHVEAAHKMLTNGVIGLVIIFSAWTLAQFVIYALKVSVQEVTP
ncbi:hypothetical protein HYW94_00465 [Candidatus Uhrbacteria bacterium]|nr:hypothetical protein [Candidatus Uhrbacteria bacterium]